LDHVIKNILVSVGIKRKIEFIVCVDPEIHKDRCKLDDRDGAITLVSLSSLPISEQRCLEQYADGGVLTKRGTSSLLWAPGLQLPERFNASELQEVPVAEAHEVFEPYLIEKMQHAMNVFGPPWSSSSKRRRVNRVKHDLEAAQNAAASICLNRMKRGLEDVQRNVASIALPAVATDASKARLSSPRVKKGLEDVQRAAASVALSVVATDASNARGMKRARHS